MFPPVVLANMGSALMWAAIGHLALGNLMLGAIEGMLLYQWLRRRGGEAQASLGKAIGWMVAANYLSAFIGMWWVDWYRGSQASTLSLYEMPATVLHLAVVAFLLTLLIEWPFVIQVVRQVRLPQGRKYGAEAALLCVGVHFITYGLLALWYGAAHDFSLITQTRQAEKGAEWIPKEAWVYYISGEEWRLYRSRLDGSERELVSEMRLEGAIGAWQDQGGWQIASGRDEVTTLASGKKGTLLDRSSWLTLRNSPEVAEAMEVEPSGYAIGFTRKASKEVVRLGVSTLVFDNAYTNAIWLPGDIAVVSAQPLLLLLNAQTMELHEIARDAFRPFVIWEGPEVFEDAPKSAPKKDEPGES